MWLTRASPLSGFCRRSIATRQLDFFDQRIGSSPLIWAEFGNVLWKKWRCKEIEAKVAQSILQDFRRFPVDVHSSELLVQSAWEIAAEFERTVYDSLYLALAQNTGCSLVTADSKFHSALKSTRLAPCVLWIEGLPA